MRYNGDMTLVIDTLQASETLREAGFKKKEAEALVKALSPSSDHVVTEDKLDAATSEIRADLNKQKAELIVWMVGLQIAAVSLIVALLG